MRIKDIKKDWTRNKSVYRLAIPVVLYFLIWNYIPMGGILLAFEDYSARGGIFFSEWIGLKNFIDFFQSYYLWRLIRNTLVLSIYSMIINFPAPFARSVFFLRLLHAENHRSHEQRLPALNASDAMLTQLHAPPLSC